MSHAPNDYALIIGINAYPDWAQGKKSLKGAVRDAEKFRDWLSASDGGGVPAANMQLILSENGKRGPLQQAIDDALTALKRLSSTNKDRRRFYFYFSGHGHSPAMSGGAQAMGLANWSPETPRAALDLKSYVNATVACFNFREGVFFLDCCRSREFTPLGKGCEHECQDPNFTDRQHALFYAAEHYKAGFESAVDAKQGDTAEEQAAHGYFSQALIDILNEGAIEVEELKRRLGPAVSRLAAPKNQTARGEIFTSQDVILGIPKPDPFLAGPVGAPAGPADTFGPFAHKSVEVGKTGGPQPFAVTIALRSYLQTDNGIGTPGEITVYRDGRQIASSLTGNFFAHLEAGSYTAVIRHGDATEERAFTVQDETDLSYDLPRRNSAAPLWGSVDTHETISEVVKHASTTIGKGVACGAFIVFRSKDSLTVPKGRDRFRIMDIGQKEGAGEPITFIELPPA